MALNAYGKKRLAAAASRLALNKSHKYSPFIVHDSLVSRRITRGRVDDISEALTIVRDKASKK